MRTDGLLQTAIAAAIATLALVGTRVLLDPGQAVVGSNPAFDFQIMTWSLVWWPWAVAHAADPFHTTLLCAPVGFSPLWMTSIPFPALLALPLTVTAGPLVAYNVLAVAAVVLAACAAYLLCFELTTSRSASLLGGLMFGFSPYMLGHMLSEHLNLTFVFPVPLIGLLAVRCARGKTTARRYVAVTALLLIALAGSSVELFVDFTLVAAVGGAIALAGSRAHRAMLRRVAVLTGLAYAASRGRLRRACAVSWMR